MTRYIDIEKLIFKLNEFAIQKPYTEFAHGYNYAVDEIINYFEAEKTDKKPHIAEEDVDIINHGYWVEHTLMYKCSVCGAGTSSDMANYCFMCGAKMDGDENDKVY